MDYKILVVEDNKDTRDLLYLYLKNAGFSVVTAVDGKEGLEMVTAEKPDLIIADYMMPAMNGVEMTKVLRSHQETAQTPIVILTAHSISTAVEAMEAGADKTFYKPFDFDKIIVIVRELLEQAKVG